MSREQSISSSIEDYQSEVKSKKSLKHQISTLSIKSVSEFDGQNDSQIDTESFSGQPKLNSTEINKYDETFETEHTNESNNYSETFESSSSSDSSRRSPAIQNEAVRRPARTLSPASFESISSEINDQTLLNDNRALNELKKVDFVKYVRAKIEINRRQVTALPPKVKCHPAQIKKLIGKTQIWSTCQPCDNKYNDCKIEPYLINKLKTKHLIKKINEDQLKKIDNFGSSLKLPESVVREAYYRSKLDQIKYAMSKNEFEKNEIGFCDGILKIGELARDLPKLSDDPNQIWNKLMKPLNDLKVNKKAQE